LADAAQLAQLSRHIDRNAPGTGRGNCAGGSIAADPYFRSQQENAASIAISSTPATLIPRATSGDF
jgi:hypothetical protein